jgi:hypothetical protein
MLTVSRKITPMDFVAILIVVAFVGLMIALVEGIDRI